MKDFATKLTDTFWDRIGDARAGMLDVSGRAIPMSPYADRENGVIWFITADGSDAAHTARGAGRVRYLIGDSAAKIYADIEGSLTVADNPDKLDELWSPVASAWFEDGREDDDVRLLAFRPATAEVWATDGAAGFLYEVTKANLTDDTPDAGDHGKITF
ncbi:pyridoxamine 5'-phosphate oxidase family protein [Pseudooceanicola atlanticus]|jgi:general stress protein 26|uniref:General stress protein n=1 Tax=Pseudooceanicola atlanticus TaxID=1461694 RepID=A0A0A0EEM2_9RHOB|nr:pyridoxamine 5'-phosphate oxidase family protein [Pseudooceanicola atlanticus]KGM48553.1 general stress protein [Pseudooceanicola atlanticus]